MTEQRGSMGEHWESTREQRGSIGEHRGSIKEHGGSVLMKRALAEEQSGETLVSSGSRVALGSGNIYRYTHLMNKQYQFTSHSPARLKQHMPPTSFSNSSLNCFLQFHSKNFA